MKLDEAMMLFDTHLKVGRATLWVPLWLTIWLTRSWKICANVYLEAV